MQARSVQKPCRHPFWLSVIDVGLHPSGILPPCPIDSPVDKASRCRAGRSPARRTCRSSATALSEAASLNNAAPAVRREASSRCVNRFGSFMRGFLIICRPVFHMAYERRRSYLTHLRLLYFAWESTTRPLDFIIPVYAGAAYAMSFPLGHSGRPHCALRPAAVGIRRHPDFLARRGRSLRPIGGAPDMRSLLL